MAGTTSFAQKLGNSVKKVSENKSSSWWYNHHMRAASRAISQRIPLVDFVLEVRDARVIFVPFLYAYQLFDEMSQTTILAMFYSKIGSGVIGIWVIEILPIFIQEHNHPEQNGSRKSLENKGDGFF
ncbi:hypothetical protein HanLR1_Chr01g0029471 [Helianthus annuus]|nr:hypothetical protein HanHA89_Chr01g0030871 [Helianthus annuus]KAJ0784191.1 hypothetical protein HanLR1_Chr01g0029471 [Helianthus annuus]